jgi:hypothetical protein
MMNFENQHFQKLAFSRQAIGRFFKSAARDLKIAEESVIPEVIFKFSYDALIKLGIALIAEKGYKVRSAAGHHIKILEGLSRILEDEDIVVLGDKMRQERNLNLYEGGFFAGEKDSREYLVFVKQVFQKAAAFISAVKT